MLRPSRKFSRRPLRAAVVAGVSALVLTAGAGTASAQGSLGQLLPGFDLTSLLRAGVPGAVPAPIPEEVGTQAFAGRLTAAVNEARSAAGIARLTADPALQSSATARAAELASGRTTAGEVPAPAGVGAADRSVLAATEGSGPQQVVTTMLGDSGLRERLLDPAFIRIGTGVAVAADGTVHVVQDFGRG